MNTGMGPHLRLQAIGVLVHWCPGCHCAHEIHLSAGTHPQRKKWTWNESMAKPTFDPDFVVERAGGGLCHYRIFARSIEFFPDSTHALAGKTVDLPIYPTHRT